jgi:N-acetylneuraminate synthase
LVRGVYAKRDLPEGHILSDEDVYLAIPLQKGQISCRELMRGEVLLSPIRQDQPVMIDKIDTPYSSIPALKEMMYSRGLEGVASDILNLSQSVGEKPAPGVPRPAGAAVN